LVEFPVEITRRVSAVRAQLEAARRSGEHYDVDVHGAELESLLRIAAENGVEVPPA
jgi:hypothetical protein